LYTLCSAQNNHGQPRRQLTSNWRFPGLSCRRSSQHSPTANQTLQAHLRWLSSLNSEGQSVPHKSLWFYPN